GLAFTVPWGLHETDLANRRNLVHLTALPSSYTILAGTPDPARPIHEYPAYYPADVKAHPGDTITFNNPTPDVPHTVTFGVAPDRSDQPVFGSHDGGPIPIVAGPCATDVPLSTSSYDCPNAVSSASGGSP